MGTAILTGLLLLLQLQPIEPAEPFKIVIEGREIATVQKEDVTLPFSGVPLIDEHKLQGWIDSVKKEVDRPPINAILNDAGKIIPEKKGLQIDVDQVKLGFYAYYYGSGIAKLENPTIVLMPKVDQGLLAQVRQKKIGQYTTYFNSRNHNRSHNIKLAAEAINNYVLLPGEIFSFNKVVGKRTRAKGYLEAPIIVKGELSEGIGGGICQVSSTLFNAIDRAGIHIVKRYSHSREVPYVPPGRDATVSWNGPDLVFQNKYPYPVLIRAKSIYGQVYVSIHSFPELEHEPRHVPGVSKQLPEEVKSEEKRVLSKNGDR